MSILGTIAPAAAAGGKAQNLIEVWGKFPDWQQITAIVVGGFILHLIIRFVLLRGLRNLANKTDNDLDDRLLDFVRKFYGIALLIAMAALILKALGIPITPILASAGILGIAIGMAAKETLADILAGVFLITDRPIAAGDRIKIERIGTHWGSWGDVLDIGLRRTKIRNVDGVVVNYPNSVISNSVITNFSCEDTPVRVRVRFQVGFDADLDLVVKLANEVANATAGVIAGTSETVIRAVWDDDTGHASGGVLVESRYKIEEIAERTRIRSKVLKVLLEKFRENGVDLATQTIDLRQRQSEID